jgi:hypothetical protein
MDTNTNPSKPSLDPLLIPYPLYIKKEPSELKPFDSELSLSKLALSILRLESVKTITIDETVINLPSYEDSIEIIEKVSQPIIDKPELKSSHAENTIIDENNQNKQGKKNY